MGGRRWTADEIKALTLLYRDHGAEAVVKATGRTIDAVRHLASRLGLEATHHKQRVEGVTPHVVEATEHRRRTEWEAVTVCCGQAGRSGSRLCPCLASRKMRRS